MYRLARVDALSREDRHLLMRASVYLALVDAGLRVFGYARVCAALEGHAQASSSAAHTDKDAERRECARISTLVDTAAKRQLRAITCLPRCLVVRHLLSQAGIQSSMHIGVRRVDSRLRAHAWLVYDSRPIAEPEGSVAIFSPLRLAGLRDRAGS